MVKKMGSTRKKTTAKMVNSEELQAKVHHYRDEVNRLKQCIGNIQKKQKESAKILTNKMMKYFR